MVIAFQPWTNKRMRANNNVPIPEDRLVPAIIGSIVFPIGLFWFSWRYFFTPRYYAVCVVE